VRRGGYGDALETTDLQAPGENQRHGVEDEVVGYHEAAVEVVEGVHVYAVPGYSVVACARPRLVDRTTLKDCDEDAGNTKSECDTVHSVDAEARVAIDC
jgi:hypothetical protein